MSTAPLPSDAPAVPEVSPLLSFEGVSFGYGSGGRVLEDFDWQVAKGEAWAILGPSGSGKTTLLQLLAGLQQLSAGRVMLRGEALQRPSQAIGLMLQDYGLLPWYTVERNVGLGLALRGLPSKERAERVAAWLARLDIAELARQFPARLSGGQRQRVALARLLALEPEVLLLDEPFSAIDELARERLQRRLFDLSRSAGATTLLVTHNIEEAVLLAERILLITDYAPIRSFEVLDTPFRGYMPARDAPAFTAFCQLIRSKVGL